MFGGLSGGQSARVVKKLNTVPALRRVCGALPLLGLALLGRGTQAMNFGTRAGAGGHALQRDSATRTISLTPSEYDSVVVIAHGLGDSAEGFQDVAQLFSQQSFLSKTKFILPTAPYQPVTLNGGMKMNSWYDIVALDRKDEEPCNGIVESSAIIKDILDTENEKHGVNFNKMILAGFSQGGALSLFTGLQLATEKKLAGILCMSGYLAGFDIFKVNPGVADTPILHCHGQSDEMVAFKWAEATKEKLIEQEVTNYELKAFPGMGHTVSMEELHVALSFIQEHLGATDKKIIDNMNVEELQSAIKAAGLGEKAVGLLEKKDLVKILKEHDEL